MKPDFSAAYGRLNDAQKQAVDTIEGPVLVIAGPGTGKTQLLALRIANILAKTDTLPSNILCLTFTESAAQNMRERLTSIIGKDAYDITISTYHAFGSELLRRYPEYFEMYEELSPADDLTIDAIFREIQTAVKYGNPLKNEIFLRDIKSLVSDAKQALLEPEDLRAIAVANQAFVDTASDIVSEHMQGFTRVSKSSAAVFTRIGQALQALDVPAAPATVVGLKKLCLDQLQNALEAAEADNSTKPLTAWKSTWLIKNAEAQFVVDGTEQNRKLRAAAEIYETYRTELARRQLFDYDDMILRAVRGLEQNPELRYTLQERYLYLLLDEYQDTNEAQSRLVTLLTDSPVHEGRPNVLAVGDDDQAIYAFQGADYSHMFKFYEQYKDVTVVPLSLNYRSEKNILTLAGAIAEQIEGRLHKRFTAINKNIVPAQPDADDAVLQRLHFRTDLAEQAWVAGKAAELIKGGVPASEIAILAPKHAYLEAIVPFLQHEGVPVRYDRRENVLDDPEIDELLTMSRLVLVLNDPNRTFSAALWPQVLSMACWNIPTSLIWQLTWQAREDDADWIDLLLANETTRSLAYFFLRLSQISVTAPLEQMIDYLAGIEPVATNENDHPMVRSPFYDHYFSDLSATSRRGAELMTLLTNLTTLRGGLREYRAHQEELLHLQDFVDYAAANRAAGIRLINSSPYQEAAEAVTLETVYKSKGKEYHSVFLLHANDEMWGGRARNNGSRISLPQNLEYIRYAGATDDERLRILYVAITRAARQLYIASHESNAAGRSLNRLKYLAEYDGDNGLISPYMPEQLRDVLQIDSQTVPTLASVHTYWHSRHRELETAPELKDLLAPRLERFQLSASALNSFLNLERSGPDNYFVRTIVGFPEPASPDASYGNAIHETLQFIHDYNKRQNALPTMELIEAAFTKRLERKRLDAQTHGLLYERGLVALDAYMAQRTHTVRRQDRSEASFRAEGVFVGKAHLTGKIDKLMLNEQLKTITIIDYKTGKSHTRWNRETKLHFYRYQLYFYKLLVERSQSYRGWRVEDAYLEFVEPDNDGTIQELHITFDQDIEARVCKLIERVWQHTMLLDFPSVEDFGTDLKAIEAFEDWLISEQ